MNPAPTSAARLVAELRPGMRVFVPGMSGESQAFFDALRDQPDRAEGVSFVGVHFPGINRNDYLGLHPQARQRAYFMSPALRAGAAEGRAELMPLDYPGIFRDLSGLAPVDLAIAQVTPPDAAGLCSLGPSCDFHPAVWARARRRIAHLNPLLPRTRGAFTLHARDFDAVFEQAEPGLAFDAGRPDEPTLAHARGVAALVRDGDTLEFGIGKLQAAILQTLRDHRRLRVWSGMASTPVLDLIDSGAIRGRAVIQVGVALGDAAFYERLGRDESFLFRPVSETHDVRRIARIRSFCAINSAVEVDLFGQVNADAVRGRLVAGVGGLPAFVAGAGLSRDGRSIIALPAATDDGRDSRIVAQLAAPGFTALPRHLADHVVTEHGTASLRGLSLHERARALIDIAAPAFRDELARQWEVLARGL